MSSSDLLVRAGVGETQQAGVREAERQVGRERMAQVAAERIDQHRARDALNDSTRRRHRERASHHYHYYHIHHSNELDPRGITRASAAAVALTRDVRVESEQLVDIVPPAEDERQRTHRKYASI